MRPATSDLVGQKVNAYVIKRVLGSGSMATVYEAEHEELRTRQALKVIKPEFVEDPEYAARFVNEARAASLVHHPGVLHVVDYGQLPAPWELAYILMEFIDGESLWTRFERTGGVFDPLVPGLIQQAAQAMAVVHEHGIVHRDLKPQNLIVTEDRLVAGGLRVKVVDFGVAKLQERHYPKDATFLKTAEGVGIGTMAYMPPEQWGLPDLITDRADVYALGCTLYRLLTGKPIFDSTETIDLFRRHREEVPRPLTDHLPWLPAPLCELLAAMLQKIPSARPSMVEVAAALGPFADGRLAPPRGLLDRLRLRFRQPLRLTPLAERPTQIFRRKDV